MTHDEEMLLWSPPAPDDALLAHELRARVRAAIATLTPREEAVLSARFGLDSDDSQTLEATSALLGLSRWYVSQAEARAIRKLRHPSRSKYLRVFVEGL